MTESLYSKSERVKEIFSSLEANRAYSAWESLARALLLAGLRFWGVRCAEQAPAA